jgi:hypothetical protein
VGDELASAKHGLKGSRYCPMHLHRFVRAKVEKMVQQPRSGAIQIQSLLDWSDMGVEELELLR